MLYIISIIKKNFILQTIIYNRAIQSIVFFISILISMGLSFITSILVTRYLGPNDYGNLKFIITLWGFLDIIVSFGLFHSAGQLLIAEENFTQIRKISGATLIIATGMGVILTGILIVLAKPIDILFKIKISTLLIALSPLVIVLPIKDAQILILQATNKIFALSLLNVLPSLFYLIFLISSILFGKTTVSIAIIGQQISLFITILVVVILLKPKIMNFREYFLLVKNHQKSYGLPVYVSILCSVAIQQLNRISIAYWVDTASIGYFSLASQLIDPIRLIPSTVATSSFKQFWYQKRISNKLIGATIASTGIVLLVLIFFLGEPLGIFFPKEFVFNISPLARVATIGAVFQGFGDLLNRFLGAHGKGVNIRNTSFIVGISYAIGFILLTPIFGVWGALTSQILASTSYFMVLLYFYRKEISKWVI